MARTLAYPWGKKYPVSVYRKFNGKQYEIVAHEPNKSEALRTARIHREHGGRKARIVKTKKGYLIYTRGPWLGSASG